MDETTCRVPINCLDPISFDWDFGIDWDFADGTIIENAEEEETHTYAANETYTIRLNVTDSSGNKDSMEKNLDVTITIYGDDVLVIDAFSWISLFGAGVEAIILVVIHLQRKKRR